MDLLGEFRDLLSFIRRKIYSQIGFRFNETKYISLFDLYFISRLTTRKFYSLSFMLMSTITLHNCF